MADPADLLPPVAPAEIAGSRWSAEASAHNLFASIYPGAIRGPISSIESTTRCPVILLQGPQGTE